MTNATDIVAPWSFEERFVIDEVATGSWDYLDAQTQHVTHNIHRYSGKFIPQIAARAIALLTTPGELVLDPYCGSGTTLVEAALQGRRALGIDLNPLAVLIARTKVTPVSAESLAALLREMAHAVESLTADGELPLLRSVTAASDARAVTRSDPRLSDEWFCKWFQPSILQDLVVIDHAIRRVKDTRLRNVARVAFSDILRKSSNAHSGYPNVMFDRNAPERTKPVRPFLTALERVCQMVASLEETDVRWGDVGVEHGTAAALGLDDNSVDAIVTHPPYIGSVPYAEYGALSLKWFGLDPKALDKDLTGGRRQSPDVVDRFREGYCRMMLEAARVLRPGRYAFLMVGNPVVRGATVDLAAMTIDLAHRAGLRLVVRTERKGVNRRANKMGAEHLLFFRKPPLTKEAGERAGRLRHARMSEVDSR